MIDSKARVVLTWDGEFRAKHVGPTGFFTFQSDDYLFCWKSLVLSTGLELRESLCTSTLIQWKRLENENVEVIGNATEIVINA